MSVVRFTLELAGDVSSFTPSVQAQIQGVIAALAGVNPSAVELTISPGSVIIDVRIQTYAVTAALVQSTMASATSSANSATAMLASVTGVSIVVLAVVTPPTIATIPPPPAPSLMLTGASTSGALTAKTSGSMGIIIGAIAGVVIGLVLALVFVRRRCHLNKKRPKNGGLQVQNGQQIGLQVQNGQPIGLQVPKGREAQQHKLDALPVTMASSSSSSSAAAAPQSQSVLVPRLPDLTLPVAMAAPNVIPTLELRYAIGSRVYVKRSNGEETVAFVQEYDAEKALYTVELERLGSGKAKTCRDKDLRAVDVVEGVLYSARAAVFPPFQAAQEPEPAEEAAQAEAAQAEAARAATEEEEAQAPEAARVQVMEPIVPPAAVRTVDELRNRRSIFNCPRDVVPPAAFVLTCEKQRTCHQAPRSKTLGQCAAEGDTMSSVQCPS